MKKTIFIILSGFVISFITIILVMLFYNFMSKIGVSEFMERDRAYDILEQTVRTYKDELTWAFNNFQRSNYGFNIPFDKFSLIFSYPDAKNYVYAALGYDSVVVNKLSKIINSLDLTSNDMTGDIKVVYDLLYLLKKIIVPIDEILNEHLSDSNLTKISASKDAGTISLITFNLKRAIARKEDLVLQIIRQILLIDLISEKQTILQALKSIVNNGNINSDIRLVREMSKRILKLVK
ncbi:hypothetical protein baBA2_000937 (plasmid) [Borrelia anserina]|nr:hypothetical protein [Borrelia anserina]APR65343.1 hypothetical protein N187_A24 [Borrelia anserina Es]UPA07311.1 hypothetical protein baBA2_000937 [Borrelia anserina]